MSDFAHGAIFYLDRYTPDVIINLTKVGGFEITTDDLDTTDHDSADGAREYIAGLIDGGTVPIEGNMTATEALKVATAIGNRDITYCSVVLPSIPTTTFQFRGYANSLVMGAPFDGVLPFSAVFKVTGVSEFGVVGAFALSSIADLLVDGDTRGLGDVAMTTGGTLGDMFFTT